MMQIAVSCPRFRMTEGLRDYALRRVRLALERHGLWVARVDVHLGEAQTPEGVRRKFCRVVVHFPLLASVLVRQADANAYAAVDGAAERARCSVARRVAQRLFTKRRFGLEGGQPPGGKDA